MKTKMVIPESFKQSIRNIDGCIYKVSFLLSYDYEYLKTSIPLIYPYVDSIVLAVDMDYRTWSGNKFSVNSQFYLWLENLDCDRKITIYKDDFYIPELTSSENEIRERNMIGKFYGQGGWHIQIDADEYFLNFDVFIKFLKSKKFLLNNAELNPVTICVRSQTLYKQITDFYLFATDLQVTFPIATNWPKYIAGRGTESIKLFFGYTMIHHSWARNEDEMWMKLSNWTHNTDFDIKSYFKLWCSIDKANYKYISNFHPMLNGFWDKLEIIPGKNLDEVINKFAELKNVETKGIFGWLKQKYYLKKFLSNFF